MIVLGFAYLQSSNLQVLLINGIDSELAIAFLASNFFNSSLGPAFCCAFALAHEDAFAFLIRRVGQLESLNNNGIALLLSMRLNSINEVFKRGVVLL